MTKSKQAFDKRQEQENRSLNQGYVREEDLQPETEDGKMTTQREVDSYARKAESGVRATGDELQGEGDYKAAESYNEAAKEFAQKQDKVKAERP